MIKTKTNLNEQSDVTGKFPDYPDEDEGGSTLIFKNKTVTELQEDIENMEVINF